MTCEEVRRLIKTNVESQTIATIAAVIAHFRNCASCEDYRQEIKRAMGKDPDPAWSQAKADRVKARLQNDHEALEMIYGKQPPQ